MNFLSVDSIFCVYFLKVDISSDRVALISKRRLVVEEDIEAGSGDDSTLGLTGELHNSSNVPPPPWIDDLLDIRYNCTIISQKMKELDNLQNKHLQRPTFDDDTSTELQIEEITQNITRVSLQNIIDVQSASAIVILIINY